MGARTKLEEGDVFTIEGCGVDHRGRAVWAGRSVDTGRKCNVVRLTKFRAGRAIAVDGVVAVMPKTKKDQS